MARYIEAIDLPLPLEAAFEYMADFSRTAEWDPGVAEARRITPGPVRRGSRFHVSIAFLGTRTPFEYRIVEFEPHSRIVFEGGDASMRSIDELTFTPRPGGTRVTYEARIELLGLRRFADPLFDLVFQTIGQRAVAGLRKRFAKTTYRADPDEYRAA